MDAKSPLVKFALDKGQVVERKVAARHKDFEIEPLAAEFLKPFKKKLGKGAAEQLKERIGGNVRLLQSELEKLATYAEGSTIESADVALLVAHTREEEYFELSEALQNRSLKSALDYAEDAMGQGTHALQLLGAVASVTRGMLENHERLEKYAAGGLPRSFPDFKSRPWGRACAAAMASASSSAAPGRPRRHGVGRPPVLHNRPSFAKAARVSGP